MSGYFIGRLLGAALALAGAVNVHSARADINTFSEGWRMGELNKYSVKGMISKTGEGELSMGNESSPWRVRVGSGDTASWKQMNPWAFSSTTEQHAKYRPMVGSYIAIRYRQLQAHLSVDGDTDYRVEEMVEVDPALAPKQACQATSAGGSKSDGDRVGRIVKASTKGTLSKSWEIIMQIGSAGGQFVEMSLLDESMYNCAVSWLRSGRKVKVTYNQSFLRNPLARDTTYDVIGIAPVQALAE